MADLEEISQHIHDKISSLQLMLDLSVTELPQHKIKKLGQELFTLERLLEEFEKCVDQQKQQLKHLKETEESFQKTLEDVMHIKDNSPIYIPRKNGPVSGSEAGRNQHEAVDHQADGVKKTSRNFVKEMEFITTPEFESIPQYMKGRVSYEQLNAAVQSFNAAVTAKYKILRQPGKTLNNHSRKLQQRFKDQETKETRGRGNFIH
ncbi:spindle and kinetochore-associated protein 1 isoform X2 [Melanotaenia boesemani]|uniref:spindle and kinetochore-associated protein 1 isoform X2 n=1 Tax=Melanotaenia boesemani TaxID=1250792 RepID=UPI001C05D7A3|nr:spindle and kinetochore-associated protein 1 isoform X2 [Melanotaenia boesemani]